MTGPFQTAQDLVVTTVPVEFEVLTRPSAAPRERLMRQAIFFDFAPRSAIKWLLAIDVAELS